MPLLLTPCVALGVTALWIVEVGSAHGTIVSMVLILVFGVLGITSAQQVISNTDCLVALMVSLIREIRV